MPLEHSSGIYCVYARFYLLLGCILFLGVSNIEQLNIETESFVGADASACTTAAVCKFCGYPQGDFSTLAHKLQTFAPAFDNAVEGEIYG